MTESQVGPPAGSVSRRRFLTLAGGAGAVALAGCTEDRVETCENGGDLSGSINIAGSSTVFPLMSAIAEEFSREYSEVEVDLSQTGSGAGFSEHFCPGNSDFNNASRPIKGAEEEQCASNGVEFVELVVATDALTVIVNNDADFIDCITVEELARIWEEDPAETWQEVRSEWPDEPISRYGSADTSGTYDYFIENVQGAESGHTDDYQATEQDNTIVQGVRGNEYAIGYFGFSYFYQNPGAVKAVAIDNGDGCVRPSLDTASAGEYQPLSRSLYTYAAKDSLAKDHVAEFARYFLEKTTSEEIVADRVGYVPNTEEVKDEQLDKLETAIAEVQ